MSSTETLDIALTPGGGVHLSHVGMEDCYMMPNCTTENCNTHSLHNHSDSGIDSACNSVTSGGKANPAFLHSPVHSPDSVQDCMETSFSDEQKVLAQSKSVYVPMSVTDNGMSDKSLGPDNSQELNLPPPPGRMWLPHIQSAPSSGDGVVGNPGYPTYIQPTMSPNNNTPMRPQNIHPSMMSHSGSTETLTPEEQAVLMKFRQEKMMKKGTARHRESLTPGSPGDEGGHLYEELPGAHYAPNTKFIRQGSSSEGACLPPRMPPLSSLPSASMASGIDRVGRTPTTPTPSPLTEKFMLGYGLTSKTSVTSGSQKASNPLYEHTELPHNGQKRSNPLYDSSDSGGQEYHPSYTSDESSGDKSKIIYAKPNKDTRNCGHRLYCIGFLLVLVISTAALLISLLVVMGAINVKDSGPVLDNPQTGASTGGDNSYNNTDSTGEAVNEEMKLMLQELANNMSVLVTHSNSQKEELSALKTQVGLLESRKIELEGQLNNTIVEFSEYTSRNIPVFTSINSTLLMLNSELSTLEGSIESVNTNLTYAVEEVSKQQGPPGLNGTQGPQGFIDITLCTHDKKTLTVSYSQGPDASTSTQSVTDNSTVRNIGVYCVGRKFDSIDLSVTDVDDGKEYKCRCYGGIAETKLCTMHYWKCSIPADSLPKN